MDSLGYTYFWWHWSNKFPKLVVKSKALGVCGACYIFCNYYKSLRKESYKRSNDFIDDDDDDDADDDSVDGDEDVNYPDVITDVELELQNIKYTNAKRHDLLSHLQRIQVDYLKERRKNKIIYTNARQSCNTT